MRPVLCLTALEIHCLVYNWMEASHRNLAGFEFILGASWMPLPLSMKEKWTSFQEKKPALVYSFIIQKLPVSGFLKDSEIFTMLHFCLRFFCIQVFCLHLLQLNSIATNKSWNACFASKPVLQISSYVHTLIHIVGSLADEYFVPDVNVTAQRPFLMCISAKKQGPP